jgi:hypothetical protein
MALGNLREIGPVTVDYRNPSLRWTAEPTNGGMQPCTISGTIPVAQGHTLRELCANEAARITKQGFSGVLEWIEMDGDHLAPLAGNYLLQRFDFDVDRAFVYGGRVAFTLTAVYIPEDS